MKRHVVLLALVLSGCGSGKAPTTGFDLEKCTGTGLCECTSNDECPGAKICVNGWCEAGSGVGGDVTTGDGTVGADVAFDVPTQPGAFGAPCDSDDECDSNVCMEVAPGLSVCTRTCIAECPAGWDCRGISEGDALVFYCLPKLDRLCQPCLTDGSCTGAKNLCVDVGGVASCGRDCAAGLCPGGYTCQDVTSVDGAWGPQCLPKNGFCQCTPENVGEAFQCDIANEHGECPGIHICLEDGALTPCSAKTPAPEACDDTDNDCDGFTDEDVNEQPCAVDNEFGSCAGAILCLPGGIASCTAAEAEAESCDNLDNDCDDAVDEDFRDDAGHYVALDHCGGCGQSCVGLFAHATGVACEVIDDAAECRVTACEEGFVLAQSENACLPAIHHLCEPCTDDASCVGPGDRCLQLSPTDLQTFCGRDCSEENDYGIGCPTGYTCETLILGLDGDEEVQQCVPLNGTCDCTEGGAGQKKPCTVQNAAGTCYGVAFCDPGAGWIGCTADTPEPELCDGTDNDCDGIIDQGLTLSDCEASNEYGTCAGQVICLGAGGSYCTAPSPLPETCNGLDDDCDGGIDEDFATEIPGAEPPLLVYDKSVVHCGGCGVPCTAQPPAAAVACQSEGGVAVCVVTACEDGWYPSAGKTCLPLPTANLCLPCAADPDCLGPTDQCIAYDDGSFCGRDCSEGSPYTSGAPGDPGSCTGLEDEQGCCPDGYLCVGGQCLRESQSCTCNQDGKLRPCQVVNDAGVCTGFEVCVASGSGAGWQACDAAEPVPEVCDGVDNDCDGLFDVLDPDIDVSGLVGYPTCFNVSDACTGVWTCGVSAGVFQWFCSAKDPFEEICNGVDDDCDGAVDEDFVDADGAFGTLGHCGQCNLDCAEALANLQMDGDGILDGAVECQADGDGFKCVPIHCAEGFYPFPEDDPTVCLPLQAGSCNPCVEADDCPGPEHGCFTMGIDDGSWCAQRCDDTSPYPGCVGVEGEQGCCPDGFTCEEVLGGLPWALYCRPVSGTCQCGEDNAGLERPCTLTAGGGELVCYGISACEQSGDLYTWTPCDIGGNVEVCDGVDNDCDGVVDEGFLEGGVYASDQHCGACGKNCALKWSATEQHVIGICDTDLPGGPDCVLGPCGVDAVGGGRFCSDDGDCAGDVAGTTCDPDLWICTSPCATAGDCPGGVCADGRCAPACGGDGDCAQLYGDWSVCSGGACRTVVAWTDLDDWTGNGCECPSIPDLDLDEPDTFDSFPAPGAAYIDRDCDGIDGDLDTALFVSAGGVGGDGSLGAPFGTVQQAVDAFDADLHSHVLVATGTYPERIVLANGVKLYGGYSPDFSQRDILLYPTVLGGPAPDFGGGEVTPGTIYGEVIIASTVVSGFTILGYDVPGGATAMGQPSYAVYLVNSANSLHLVNNHIVAGQGGAGANGANGDAGQNGSSGAPGLHSAECGNQNCSGYSQPGGDGGSNANCAASAGCPGMESEGAETTQIKDNPLSGCVYPNGGTDAAYQGGPSYLCKYDCTVNSNMVGSGGVDGSGGGAGSGGGGCTVPWGLIQGGHWATGVAGAASGGGAGSGGQGGAAGAGVNNYKNASACSVGNPVGDLGGTGGGGGAGGCGGTAGQPGLSGGGSFAVFLTSGVAGTWPDLSANRILRGYGGPGGVGGNGGTG
ncbi:MAG: MopE-related protein, partial [Pseudomonadota bacterium]